MFCNLALEEIFNYDAAVVSLRNRAVAAIHRAWCDLVNKFIDT
jgi:hypothetical protein